MRRLKIPTLNKFEFDTLTEDEFQYLLKNRPGKLEPTFSFDVPKLRVKVLMFNLKAPFMTYSISFNGKYESYPLYLNLDLYYFSTYREWKLAVKRMKNDIQNLWRNWAKSLYKEINKND